MVYSCFSEVIVRSSKTTTPPPSTVSIVRASKFGVSASKSCNWHHHQCVSDQCTREERPHLQHTHAVGVSKYLVSLCIVAVAYSGGSYKQLKGVVRVNINATTLQLLLQLTHALLTMTEVCVREKITSLRN